jgi:hypothetical protein
VLAQVLAQMLAQMLDRVLAQLLNWIMLDRLMLDNSKFSAAHLFDSEWVEISSYSAFSLTQFASLFSSHNRRFWKLCSSLLLTIRLVQISSFKILVCSTLSWRCFSCLTKACFSILRQSLENHLIWLFKDQYLECCDWSMLETFEWRTDW